MLDRLNPFINRAELLPTTRKTPVRLHRLNPFINRAELLHADGRYYAIQNVSIPLLTGLNYYVSPAASLVVFGPSQSLY